MWLEQEFKDDDGDVFYYNRVTEQSQVPPPPQTRDFLPSHSLTHAELKKVLVGAQWEPPAELRASISSARDELRTSVRSVSGYLLSLPPSVFLCLSASVSLSLCRCLSLSYSLTRCVSQGGLRRYSAGS